MPDALSCQGWNDPQDHQDRGSQDNVDSVAQDHFSNFKGRVDVV